MRKTVLEIIQQATLELSQQKPLVVVSTSDAMILQFLALTQALGEELVKENDWQILTKTHTFQTVAGTSSYSLPSDFERLINQTQWNQTTLSPISGPQTPQQWQASTNSMVSSLSNYAFRIVQDKFHITPTPTTVETLSFEYISGFFIDDGNGVMKQTITTDSDEPVFDSRLMISGVKMKFYESKGFDTSALSKDFYSRLDYCISQDQGAPVLSLSRRPSETLISIRNVPDGSWSV